MESLHPRCAPLREPAVREAEGVLIEDALRGRTEAFADLVRPHLTSLNRMARLRLRCDSDAEDVVQESMLLAFRHLGQFRRDASFKTWLSSIAFNEVVHVQRGRAYSAARPLDDRKAAMLEDASRSPHKEFEQRQNCERLHKALTQLPEKYRQLIQLRDLRELSIAETAQSLAMTVGAVKTRHHRARKLLVRSLGAVKARRSPRTN
jgi:RNA polymerase sigma-70 factor (ECF subfamily)